MPFFKRIFRSADLAPVNYSVPQIQITGKGVCMSFIVECSQIPIPELATDGLGILLMNDE